MTWTPAEATVTSSGLTTSVTAYVTGDQLGTELTLATVSGANNGFGVITAVEFCDDGDIMGALDVFIFSDSTSPASDNAAGAWSDADAVKAIGGTPITIPAPADVGGARIGGVGNLWIPYQSGSGHDDLFINMVTRSGHTFFTAADDLHLRFSVLKYS